MPLHDNLNPAHFALVCEARQQFRRTTVKLERVVMAMILSGALAVPAMAQSGGSTGSTSGAGDASSQQQSSGQSGTADAAPQTSQSSNPQADQDTGGKKTKKSKSNPDATNTKAGNAGDMNMKTVARKDRMFMEKAAMGGLMEVDLGNAAKDKGQSQEVKDFGNRMVTDHSKANDELKALMTQKGLGVPSDLPAKDKSTDDKIKAKTGADFDKAYMSHMVKDHDKDVKEFQNEAKNGTDPDVKAWAQKTVTTLEEHQKMANDIAQKVGAEGNMKHKHEAKKEAKKESKNP